MTLNIKNHRAYQLATELAELTGESLTDAVIHSLEITLVEERRRRGTQTKAERILAFADRFAAGMPKSCNSADYATLLYGDDGLPH